ncbi:MAG TPA: flagellar motor switch protein FliG [Ruminococcaceae bacterium]|nr:flagellar motor switch protein FliG [Oscillospiraceae bacterium]
MPNIVVNGKPLTSQQKAAAVMVTLGADNSAELYKHLKEDDIEALTFEIARLPRLEPEITEVILNDFYEMCMAQKVITEGGPEYARAVLEKTFGPQIAASLMDKITKSLRTKAFEFVRKADYKNLLAIIQNEHPQTIALILSYARSDQASTIISELPREKRIEVVERIARMDRTAPETIKNVERILERKFSSVVNVDLMEIGGINYIADILNHVDRGTEKYIFDELSKKDPKLADDIRKKMFVFEDIIVLDSMAIQRFVREVDNRDLVVALKGANQEVANVIYANMSQRMAETIKSDLEYLHNVRMRDVEEAQQRIVAIIRRLEEEGELVIMKGGKDEIIV